MSDRLHDERRYREVLDHLGERESLARLATPALVCDLERFDRNLSRMAETTARSGVALRPHVKSHKSSFVARRQLDVGAFGLSFAKLSEAEAVLDEVARESPGRISALITSPLVGASLAARAVDLAARCDLTVVVDAVDGVSELAECARSRDAELSLLCDVDVGLGRTGVANADQAIRVVEEIVRHEHLHFAGVQGYGGHLQHLVGRDERRSATIAASDRLSRVIAAIESHGVEVALRTGGGTGTANMDIEIGLLNELQCGSYVFMDREYRDALGEDVEGQFEQSLFVATTVISTNQDDFVTVDAGLKAMATDAGPALLEGHETANFGFFGDEQGLIAPGPNDTFRRGQRLLLVPPHCDPTVDRYDVMWLVRGDVVEAVVDVTARGCSQ